MVWAPLAVLAPSVLDAVVLLRTAALLLAYVPGRAVALPDAVARVSTWARTLVAPAVAAALVSWVALRAALGSAWWRRPALSPARGPAAVPAPGLAVTPGRELDARRS
jgi:hypothetical protein